jgi:hypothetical protein
MSSDGRVVLFLGALFIVGAGLSYWLNNYDLENTALGIGAGFIGGAVALALTASAR